MERNRLEELTESPDFLRLGPPQGKLVSVRLAITPNRSQPWVPMNRVALTSRWSTGDENYLLSPRQQPQTQRSQPPEYREPTGRVAQPCLAKEEAPVAGRGFRTRAAVWDLDTGESLTLPS